MSRVGWFEIFTAQIVGDFFLMVSSIQRHDAVGASIDLTLMLVAALFTTMVCADEETERA